MGLAYSGLLLYYAWWWHKVPGVDAAPAKISLPLSVVVAARNEEKKISALLSALQEQSYPQELVEIIVVDDHSGDGTAAMVIGFGLTNLQLVQLQGDALASSKKKALTAGIAAAKNNHLLITDADCIPNRYWIETMAAIFAQHEVEFIAAPVAYQKNNTLLHTFQTLDFITLQGITAAGVASGLHSMCNGANLGYTKQAFIAVNGFAGIDAIASGDDMLLMHKIKKSYPGGVQYVKNKKATVYTDAANNWSDFITQRIRWGSKTTAYQDRSLFWALLLVFMLNTWFLMMFAAAFFYAHLWWPLLIALALKIVVELTLVYPAAKFFNQQHLVLYFPLLQPLHIVYTVVIGLLSQKGNYQWKGRNTK